MPLLAGTQPSNEGLDQPTLPLPVGCLLFRGVVEPGKQVWSHPKDELEV